jgi:excisionase family DNA binding protein
LNKEEAAAFLGVSVRALQRYASQGKLSVTYTRGARGQVAQFNEEELKALKEQLAQPVYPQRPTVAAASYDKPSPQAVAPVTASGLVPAALGERLITALEKLQPNGHVTISLGDKLTLSLKEASLLAGLARSFLLDAIHSKKLKAAKRGRGWNIKRADLDSYISRL